MKSIKTLLILLGLICISCDNVIDCIVNRSPEIPDTTFSVGNVNGYYLQELTSEIKNEPRDDDYEYNYEIIHGKLPDGLEMSANNRTFKIEGMPTAPGTFTFTIYLSVVPPVYYDNDSAQYKDAMCSKSTFKKFTIIIR